jgi:hypothetical protein
MVRSIGPLRLRPDGRYEYVPLDDLDDATWIRVKEAAKILGWRPATVYEFLGDLLLSYRPLPHKRVVSLKSVLRLKSELAAADFWSDQAKQNRIRNWVYQETCKAEEMAFQTLGTDAAKVQSKHAKTPTLAKLMTRY